MEWSREGFLRTRLAPAGPEVLRLGLSATYRPGKNAVRKAVDAGIGLFFAFGFDTQMTNVLRDVLRHNREKYYVVSGAYNLIWGHPHLRRSLEKRLRQLGTEYIDAFLFLGVTKKREFTEDVREEFYRFREEGKIRAVGMSCHDREFAGRLAAEGAVDVLMIRYNAAHRGAERDIFPHLSTHKPGIIAYTATRWTNLLRRPRGWPAGKPVPTAGMCYRFVLTHPDVGVCLTAPKSQRELEENIAALHAGPLSDEEMQFMRAFGDAVYAVKKAGFR